MSNEVKEDPVLSLWLKFRGTKSYLVLGGICWVSMCIVNSKFIYQTVDVMWITHIKLSLGILTVRDNILVIEIGQMLSKGVEDWLFVFTCFYACFLLISWLSCEKIYFHFCTQMFSAFCVFFSFSSIHMHGKSFWALTWPGYSFSNPSPLWKSNIAPNKKIKNKYWITTYLKHFIA